MKALIGVDIGTQGTKAGIFASDGECLAQAFRASKLHRPRPGVVEEDPEAQYASVCETIRECVRKSKLSPKQIAGIGIAGQMAGVIGVGKSGRAVTPYDSWLDTRCAAQIGQMEQIAGKRILMRTGCAPSFNHGPKILWWKQKRATIYKKIAAFVQPGGYAAMRLCGLDADQAFIDKTYLHFSGFADNPRGVWDESLCREIKIDAAKLPRIVLSQSVVGELTRDAARDCGLSAGTPVVAGCGDTAASFLACGAVSEGVGIDVAGTASVFAATTRTFRPDTRHRMLGCGRSAVPGLWHPYAYINGGGMNLEWFRNEIAGGRSDKGLDFDQLNALAASITPQASDPLFIPHLGGRVCPAQPDLRGGWIGVTWQHSLAHLYRAVLEAVALEYGVYNSVLGELYPDFNLRELRITGGGARSALWNQMKANVLRTPVRRVAHASGAPCGAAMVAGWGTGVLLDLPTAARQWITLSKPQRPMKSADTDARLAVYRRLLQQLDGITRELAT
jgi:xylulokinase